MIRRDDLGRFIKGYSHKKGKTLEMEYGEERAEKIREKLRLSHLGQIPWIKGKTYEEAHGAEKAKEVKAKLSAKQRGMKKPKVSLAMKGRRNSPKTEFKKGQVPWIRGKHHSEESRKKMSLSRKDKFTGEKHPMWGKHHSVEARKKISEKSRGRKISEERKTELSILMRGENNIAKRPDVRLKISARVKEGYATGKRIPLSGELSPNWKGGYQPYYGPNWKKQRGLAIEKAKGTCQKCGALWSHDNRRCHVHHVIPFREFGLKRYEEANDLQNLIVLCTRCHRGAE